jgi:hypothetical protein
VAGVGENFYETNTFLYEMAKRTNGLWAPLRPNLAERNPLPTLPGGQPLPAGDTWGQHFALSDVGDEDGDGNFNELLERECTDSSVSPPVPFQRQIFDRWDRPKRQQVIEAIRTILAQSPVILVEELN